MWKIPLLVKLLIRSMEVIFIYLVLPFISFQFKRK